MSVDIINKAFHPQDLAGQCGEPRERVTFMIRRHCQKEASLQLCLGFSQPSRAASSPPLQPMLMLPQLAMCTLATWLQWIYTGEQGWRHLDLFLLSFVRSSLKSRMVTWIAKSYHDHLKKFQSSWDPFPLVVFFFIYLLLFSIRAPWIPSVGDVSEPFQQDLHQQKKEAADNIWRGKRSRTGSAE